ncbi:MAG TPA: alpha/beta fold hydrolase [Mycobacterium sp.]|nr:alpha/beta fold hydrolase [Mycobacterium sp.]
MLVCLGHQIPALAEHYTVIAPDLRGYGYTEKPYTGYDKRTMATDIRELMTALGYDRTAVIGHDRGARVGLRLAKDHRDFVERLAVLDNVPTRVIFEMMDGTLAKGQWWFLFNAVPNPPEALITGREDDSDLPRRRLTPRASVTPNAAQYDGRPRHHHHTGTPRPTDSPA